MKIQINKIETRDHDLALTDDVEIRQITGIELRKDEKTNAVTLRGYAAVFNSESEDFGGWREVIDPGAFKADLDEKKDVRAMIGHDTGRIIGRSKSNTLRMKEDKKGLSVEITLPDTNDARDLAANISAGNIDGMSFGFRARSAIWEEGEEYDIRRLTDVELLEVSVVAFPAYPATSIGVRSHTDFLNTKGKNCRNENPLRKRLLDLRQS